LPLHWKCFIRGAAGRCVPGNHQQASGALKLTGCNPALGSSRCVSGRAECLLADAWERLRLLCSQNCEAQRYDFGDVLCCAAQLGSKRLVICDAGGGLLAA
jgi:hypothetical protein